MKWSTSSLRALCPLLILALAASMFGQAPTSPPDALHPKLSPGDLRGLTDSNVSIATAVLVPAAGDAPEFCRVSGQILPEIRFEVSLPTVWNGRFYMFGNGGYAGESFDAPGRVAIRNRALRQGYAVAATDTGHDASIEPLGAFAVNRQKLLDYAFRAVHVTAENAKRVIQAYYGASIVRSYFEGCSTGGRQALILAQRFPRDFNGIVAGAPVLNFTGTMLSYAWMIRGLQSGPVSPAKLPLLAQKIYRRCDGKDGLEDGLIDDPRRCDFSPARDLPRCPNGTDAPDCFTAPQIEALDRIYNDVVVRGNRLSPGWPVGAEIAGPNGRSAWSGWFVTDSGRTIQVNFAETFFRYLAFPEKNPTYDLDRLNFETDPQRLEWIRRVLDATDSDLSAFKAAGGKLLMFFGWADPALNPRMGVEYYEQVLERMGPSTRVFFRLFMAPGMFHCAGGVGVSTFDWLSPLVQWVEKGTAPERILGSRMVEGKTVRTRPVCPYPQVARYKGSGSIDESDNFICVNP